MGARGFAFVAFACLPLTVLAQVYRWADEKGVTHYSQTPPMNKASREVQLRDPTGGPDPNAQPGPSVQEMENGFRQRQEERQQAEAKQASQRRVQCANLRDRYFALKGPARRIIVNGQYISDAERETLLAEAEANYNRNCR